MPTGKKSEMMLARFVAIPPFQENEHSHPALQDSSYLLHIQAFIITRQSNTYEVKNARMVHEASNNCSLAFEVLFVGT